MTKGKERRVEGVDWLSLVSLGVFLVLLGVIWIITPGLSGKVIDFFKDFHLEKVTGYIILPAPERSHPVVYKAATWFCLAFGVFHIVILALRFLLRESRGRKTGTVSGIVFWLGVGFFLNMLAAGSIVWFGFLAGLIICLGLMIVVSSLVDLLFKAV